MNKAKTPPLVDWPLIVFSVVAVVLVVVLAFMMNNMIVLLGAFSPLVLVLFSIVFYLRKWKKFKC